MVSVSAEFAIQLHVSLYHVLSAIGSRNGKFRCRRILIPRSQHIGHGVCIFGRNSALGQEYVELLAYATMLIPGLPAAL